MSAAHWKDVTIPVTITGTANIDTDYSTAFSSKGTSTVAGIGVMGGGLNQITHSSNFHVDSAGNIYVADFSNNRVMKWAPGASEGTVIAGENGRLWIDGDFEGTLEVRNRLRSMTAEAKAATPGGVA